VVRLWTAEKQQQQSDQFSRKLLGLGQLILRKGICPIQAEATLPTVAGFVQEGSYPVIKDEPCVISRGKVLN
jgi:hypothetical protein